MKILHIGPVKNSVSDSSSTNFELAPGLGVDGPSRSILGLASGLASLEVKTAVLPTKPFSPPLSGQNGIKFLGPFTGHKYNPFIPVHRWLDLIEREFGRPDLVNFHDVYDLFSCALAVGMRRRGWKYIVTPRGGLRKVAQERDNFKKKIANPLFFKRYLRGALFINALAQGEADDIVQFDPKLKTVIIPNGLSRSVFSLSSEEPSPQQDRTTLRLGFIGQIFVHIKGIDLLLEAIRLIQGRREGERLEFEIAGPIPRASDQDWIRRLHEQLPRKEQVRFVGPKKEKQKWDFLKSLDVFVLPSRTEGMPVVGLEAMAAGRPCLFSKGSNMADIIQVAGGGWDAGETAHSLFESLIAISRLSDKDLTAYGANAKNYVKNHFLWDQVAQRYLSEVTKALQGS